MKTSTDLSADDPETRQARRASVAVGVAPPMVLVGLMAVVADLIGPDVGLLLFAVCAAWLVYEMYRYLQVVEPLPDTEDRSQVPGA